MPVCVCRLWYFIGSATAKPVRQAYFMERLHATNAIVMSGYMVSFSSLQPQFSHQNLFEEQFSTLPLCNVNWTPPSTQPPSLNPFRTPRRVRAMFYCSQRTSVKWLYLSEPRAGVIRSSAVVYFCNRTPTNSVSVNFYFPGTRWERV